MTASSSITKRGESSPGLFVFMCLTCSCILLVLCGCGVAAQAEAEEAVKAAENSQLSTFEGKRVKSIARTDRGLILTVEGDGRLQIHARKYRLELDVRQSRGDY